MSRTYVKRAVTAVVILSATVLAAGLLGPGVSAAAPAEGTVRHANAPGAIKDSYIVVFKPNTTESRTVDDSASKLSRSYGGSLRHAYKSSVKGFSVKMTEQAAKRLAANPEVAYVEQDRTVKVTDTQSPAPWNLDRIDQPTGLDGSYTYPNTGAGVHAYIIDTGVRTTHQEFGGRASVGVDEVGDDMGPDCAGQLTPVAGHGTHVAGTVGGSTYGAAKAVQLVSVRVLDCTGSGYASDVLAGIDWVTANAVKPAVANMSLGFYDIVSAVDDAVRASVASGVTYAVAAGNSNADACATSPSDVPEAITVGATASDTDNRASFSNYGPCVDLFAPGVEITSAWNTGDTDTNVLQGTSMATPHVTGAAAIYLSANPFATPAQVQSALVSYASPGVVVDPGTGSPNRMLNVPMVSPPPTSGYTPVSPVRVLDTRYGTGAGRTTPLGPDQTLTLQVTGGATGVPANATAVVLNVTATHTTTNSYLTVYPDGQARPLASNLNFTAGQTIPNLVTVAVTNGSVDFYNANGNVDVIADLFGYYTAGAGNNYTPTSPARILDTRNGTGTGTAAQIGADQTLTLQVTGGPTGVPAGATAVVLNVTATRATTNSYLTVYPAGPTKPVASNLNFGPGMSIPNLVTVPVSNDGKVTFYNANGNVDVIADLFGYYTTGTGSVFTATTPSRILDTRNGTGTGTAGPITQGQTLTLRTVNVTAIVLNVTVTHPTAGGYLAVFPDGQPLPGVSNLNFAARQTIANLVVVPVTNGRINFYNPAGNLDAIADVLGYFTS